MAGGFGPVGVRNTILAVADIDAISGRDPNARIEIPGVGPIPKTVLDRLACDAKVFGIIFDGARRVFVARPGDPHRVPPTMASTIGP